MYPIDLKNYLQHISPTYTPNRLKKCSPTYIPNRLKVFPNIYVHLKLGKWGLSIGEHPYMLGNTFHVGYICCGCLFENNMLGNTFHIG